MSAAADPAPGRETPEERAAHIKGLRDLADWLEANPDVPVGTSGETTVQYSVTAYEPWNEDYRAACAEVGRVARLIGQDVDRRDVDCRTVSRRFGPVSYRAIAIAMGARP